MGAYVDSFPVTRVRWAVAGESEWVVLLKLNDLAYTERADCWR